MIIPRSTKRRKVRVSGGKTFIHFKNEKPGHATCKSCGAKLSRPRINIKEVKKMSKTEKQPERPFPELCSRCMREYFKNKVR